ncbi:MAG TPA: hypothetical protein VGS07_31995 [Thermoanaerobaculia bacterium]|jgi:hypothetical protein|nr:hypothetical protein [Thermoanaerobaculia bacterium]
MKNLSRVLILKIVVTTVFWFIPLLFCSIRFLHETIGFPDLGPAAIFIRLLGMAYGSLLVGYVFGLIDTLHGRYPSGTVWAGIVSNGGAFLLLSIGALQHVWDTWKCLAPSLMWASLGATGLISAGLIAFGPCGRHSALAVAPRRRL